jgi:alkanesulfonate monooxygenase SsuD/methylene tetrahydromethanopterin reductase-like flavin-dependent oxidoreductase (luciferase family)
LKEVMIYGTPEKIQKQVEEYHEVGVEYFIMSFNPGAELQAINLFGEKVLPRF